MMKIALKACRHCAFTKHHLGTKEEIRDAIGILNSQNKLLQCHEYSEPTICASHAARRKIKGIKQTTRGDLKQKYAHITKKQKDLCGLGGKVHIIPS